MFNMILQDGTRSDNALIDWLGRDMTTSYHTAKESPKSQYTTITVSLVSVSI